MPKKMKAETFHAIMLMRQVFKHEPEMPELKMFFHVFQGDETQSYLGAPGAGKLRKDMGVRAGVSDYLWLIPRGGFGYLALELKAPKHGSKGRPGRLSPEQTVFLNKVEMYQGCSKAAWGWEAAWAVVLNYYNGKYKYYPPKELVTTEGESQ